MFFIYFFIFFDKCLFTLSVTQSVCWTLNSQPFCWLGEPKHNNFDQFWKLKSISNIFQQTHDFLVLTDPVITCIYLRTTDRHFRDQGNIRHFTSKLLKCYLVQTLNTFWNPSLWIFAAGGGGHILNIYAFEMHAKCRSSRSEVFCKKKKKNSVKFTGKRLCQLFNTHCGWSLSKTRSQ